mmetsp:Transcript_9791/g.14807  ORF Transcript_9791/g.14807 Transcript_9791/m.14807 type:complete len:132 (+) Transcript_9791:58-453(+)|eukprot:CAMPEP_0194284436 /NCGR_PEP_ID=MMETSP0169-20130528/27620_1 /TAXON_ID=218684 /ORGANISM="Corethron pennatum, Strain L29A3" /LENGTH=131 /DNA_ID=CAMNT_0039030255 /DNA_START=227 /DNA_END=622 /DNA_ORIENTATION=-
MVFGFGKKNVIDPSAPLALPQSFPLAPAECTKHSAALFGCLESVAGDRLHVLQQAAGRGGGGSPSPPAEGVRGADVAPAVGAVVSEDDVLRPCAALIANYSSCVGSALKKKKNARYHNMYRVQEEYRYETK